ncbi:DNA pilot protein [Apis mellifera associated microvirus 12]|nr:DNA pilot protein [Apis mellifera associated microvirus 12]
MPLPLIGGLVAGAKALGGAAMKAAPWLVPSALGAVGAQRTNDMSRDLMRENMAWQEKMANTAKQRAVKDLEAAGLNPGLAYGYSAPMGSVSSPAMQDEIGAGVANAQQARATNVQLQAQRASTQKIAAEARIMEAQAKVEERKAAEFLDPGVSTERLNATYSKLRAEGLLGVEALRQRDEALQTQRERLRAIGLSNQQIEQVIRSGAASEEQTRQAIAFMRTMQPMEVEMMRLRQLMQKLNIDDTRYGLSRSRAESDYFDAVGGLGVGAERLGVSRLVGDALSSVTPLGRMRVRQGAQSIKESRSRVGAFNARRDAEAARKAWLESITPKP